MSFDDLACFRHLGLRLPNRPPTYLYSSLNDTRHRKRHINILINFLRTNEPNPGNPTR